MPEYVIRDAAGREVRRETTATDAIAPFVGPGETAEPTAAEARATEKDARDAAKAAAKDARRRARPSGEGPPEVADDALLSDAAPPPDAKE